MPWSILSYLVVIMRVAGVSAHPVLLRAQAPAIAIDWTHYHNHAETAAILKQFADGHRNLCKLYSIGKSFQGQDIWCLEITNYATGAAENKPGMYIDGNTHAGEVSGAEV
jgi:hypothetical protein